MRTSEAVQTMRQHILTHRSILIHAMKLAGDSTRGQSGLARKNGYLLHGPEAEGPLRGLGAMQN